MWDQRKNTRYYYQHLRINGRPVRRYVGTGEAAELVAQADQQRREAREALNDAWKQAYAELLTADKPTTGLYKAVDLLTRATLMAAGYRQHLRGDWRKQRHDQNAN